jgi:hypothetical protein
LADGEGGFLEKQDITEEYWMSSGLWSDNLRILNTGDFNGDGYTDVLLQNRASGHASYLLMAKGDGGFVDKTHLMEYTLLPFPPSNVEISGPTEIISGQEYDYTFVATDPNGDDVWYYIDWGDGEYEVWKGLYASGEEFEVSHTWSGSQGESYTIRAKARDPDGQESIDWTTMGLTFDVT